jgi:hypothetical protein
MFDFASMDSAIAFSCSKISGKSVAT